MFCFDNCQTIVIAVIHRGESVTVFVEITGNKFKIFSKSSKYNFFTWTDFFYRLSIKNVNGE